VFFLASKLLPLLFFPLGFACWSGAASVILALLGKRRAAMAMGLAGTSTLYLASLPAVSSALLRPLETRYLPAATYPVSPAIVILGGAGQVKRPPRIYPETNDWGDRVAYGALLFRQRLAPRIVVTGGVIPLFGDPGQSEASINAEVLRLYYGIDSAAILLAEGSRNTREDALRARELFLAAGLAPDIILVTSAAHMPRACGTFRKMGFTVHPAPGDFHTTAPRGFKPISLFPEEIALFQTWYALHEYLGYAIYWAKGWV
jgi:uncharacterized SAM-binding protein YcdF (DUF218 family)